MVLEKGMLLDKKREPAFGTSDGSKTYSWATLGRGTVLEMHGSRSREIQSGNGGLGYGSLFIGKLSHLFSPLWNRVGVNKIASEMEYIQLDVQNALTLTVCFGMRLLALFL